MRTTPIVIAALMLAACGGSTASPSDGGVDDGALPKSRRCAQCHMDDYLEADEPVHVGKKPPTCIVCHEQTSWRPHVTHHDWALTGAHTRGHCQLCHTGTEPIYEGLHHDCYDCHATDYAQAGFQGHDRFPKECDECHDTVDWAAASVQSREPQWTDVFWDAGVSQQELDEALDAGSPDDVDAGRRPPHRPRDAGTTLDPDIDIIGHASR